MTLSTEATTCGGFSGMVLQIMSLMLQMTLHGMWKSKIEFGLEESYYTIYQDEVADTGLVVGMDDHVNFALSTCFDDACTHRLNMLVAQNLPYTRARCPLKRECLIKNTSGITVGFKQEAQTETW